MRSAGSCGSEDFPGEDSFANVIALANPGAGFLESWSAQDHWELAAPALCASVHRPTSDLGLDQIVARNRMFFSIRPAGRAGLFRLKNSHCARRFFFGSLTPPPSRPARSASHLSPSQARPCFGVLRDVFGRLTVLNLSVRPATNFVRSGFWRDDMSQAPDFRVWAARLASKADKEPDPCESQRLMSIVEFWKRLADLDDWERDGFRPAKSPHRLS